MASWRELPADFVARLASARQQRPGSTPVRTPADRPATPRDAATVVLLRDGSGGVETYLLRRVSAMSFAAGMTVFPGGAVDADDIRGDVPWVGPPPQVWSGPLAADPALARGLVCAAVRETFEESGVLFAGPDPDTVLSTVDEPEWEAERAALERREHGLSELLVRRGLLVRADLLRPWAHWITPEAEPRRYDTRFFVAALPPGQATRDIRGEADRVLWVRPTDALDAVRRKEIGMLPPTAVTLEEVGGHATVADVLAAAAARVIEPIMPRVIVTGPGAARVALPGDEDYEP